MSDSTPAPDGTPAADAPPAADAHAADALADDSLDAVAGGTAVSLPGIIVRPLPFPLPGDDYPHPVPLPGPYDPIA